MTLDKVTAFITRETGSGLDLCLFEHPYTDIQIPAGTVEIGETPGQAALREALEETGLSSLSLHRFLGSIETPLPEGWLAICQPTKVYARPDTMSFDWSTLPRGAWVTAHRQARGFVQVTFEEWDREPDPQYVSMCITGWVPETILTGTQSRHYYWLTYQGSAAGRWTVQTDYHLFRPFWAPLTELPTVIEAQRPWLDYFLKAIAQDG